MEKVSKDKEILKFLFPRHDQNSKIGVLSMENVCLVLILEVNFVSTERPASTLKILIAQFAMNIYTVPPKNKS